MKAIMILLSVAGFISCLWVGCAPNSGQVQPQATNADSVQVGTTQLSFKTVDENGQAVSSFKEGQNVILFLSITNEADTNLAIDYWDFPVVDADFFRVYKYTDEGKLPVGKSFRKGANTRDAGPQIIPARSTATYRGPWLVTNSFYMPLINGQIPQQNARRYMPNDPPVQPLTKGKYNSSFSLNIAGQQTKISIDFSVD